jgi:hypothetical protein
VKDRKLGQPAGLHNGMKVHIDRDESGRLKVDLNEIDWGALALYGMADRLEEAIRLLRMGLQQYGADTDSPPWGTTHEPGRRFGEAYRPLAAQIIAAAESEVGRLRSGAGKVHSVAVNDRQANEDAVRRLDAVRQPRGGKGGTG